MGFPSQAPIVTNSSPNSFGGITPAHIEVILVCEFRCDSIYARFAVKTTEESQIGHKIQNASKIFCAARKVEIVKLKKERLFFTMARIHHVISLLAFWLSAVTLTFCAMDPVVAVRFQGRNLPKGHHHRVMKKKRKKRTKKKGKAKVRKHPIDDLALDTPDCLPAATSAIGYPEVGSGSNENGCSSPGYQAHVYGSCIVPVDG